jgi:glycine oxidase
MSANSRAITVLGAGILGLWQALTLARAGHRVRLIERSEAPFAAAASLYGGVMLAPDREAEAAPPVVRELGHEGIALWRDVYPGLHCAGGLVIANPRDRGELDRLAQRTGGHRRLRGAELQELEPDIAARFSEGLFYTDEAHMAAPDALRFMLAAVRALGVETHFASEPESASADEIVIDCRGIAATDALPDLRGVRGERAIVRSTEVNLRRPVQLLHPRMPIYIVPWGEGIYMVGATVIESDDAGPVSLRSALELLGNAYAVHPAFAEAQVLEMGAGVRPSFPDNVPRIIVREGGRRIFVNGAYRHGFLLAPVLARSVADYVSRGELSQLLVA